MPHWADPCTVFIRYSDGTNNGGYAITFEEVPDWIGIIRRSNNITKWKIWLNQEPDTDGFVIAQSKDN